MTGHMSLRNITVCGDIKDTSSHKRIFMSMRQRYHHNVGVQHETIEAINIEHRFSKLRKINLEETARHLDSQFFYLE